MAFDMGFNFRGTSGYVTDPSYAVPVVGESYPHTYTNGDGKSINGGWTLAVSILDRDDTNDPRLAGINYHFASAREFQIDLSSGSAPGAGTYTVDVAYGDAGGGHTGIAYRVKDNTTVVIDGTTGGLGTTTAEDEYLDATVSKITATANWTGTTVNIAFATTTVAVEPVAISDASTLAHFRLTLVEVQAIFTQDHIGRGIGRGIFAGR
jgi:hypothetical protein